MLICLGLLLWLAIALAAALFWGPFLQFGFGGRDAERARRITKQRSLHIERFRSDRQSKNADVQSVQLRD
jgi:hypothetical protein